MKQTAIEWLIDKVVDQLYTAKSQEEWKEVFEQAKQIEKEQIKKAIMFALDEDGHTGDWKIRFANEYVNNLKQQK